MQVTLGTVPAGDIAISVTAASVHAPSGQQPYALVVLGYFTGTLNSAFNPGVPAGAQTSSAQCILNPAVINGLLSTSPLTNQG